MGTQSVNGTTLHYLEKGKGEPLVLLHSFPADARVWEAQIDDLSSRWRVIAPDFRGFGNSPPSEPITVASLADDVHELLRKIGALPCVLGGVSMGGYAAMQYVMKYPRELRGLILVDTKDAGDGPEQKENRNRLIEVARTRGSTAIADLQIGKMFTPDTIAHRPEPVKKLRAMMEACPAKTIEYALIALRDRPDMSAELAKVSTSTLIIVGDSDEITPLAVAEGMKEKIPGSKLEVIKGAGHISPMEQPSQVSRAIRQFAEGLELR